MKQKIFERMENLKPVFRSREEEASRVAESNIYVLYSSNRKFEIEDLKQRIMEIMSTANLRCVAMGGAYAGFVLTV